MSILEYIASSSLILIICIFATVKVSRVRRFKIAATSLIFVVLLRFFFYDYPNFEITKIIYLFMLLYALQLLFEWDKLLELMGVTPENKK